MSDFIITESEKGYIVRWADNGRAIRRFIIVDHHSMDCFLAGKPCGRDHDKYEALLSARGFIGYLEYIFEMRDKSTIHDFDKLQPIDLEKTLENYSKEVAEYLESYEDVREGA
jgi:hypothetical protein